MEPSLPSVAEPALRVAVLGLRGFPGVQGGVETHAERLYPRLAALGCEVTVIARSPYMEAGKGVWAGIRFVRLWAPRLRGAEALLHSLLGVCYAAVSRPDLLHIHAVGPALVVPLARLLGLRVVVTHHGADYEREKWGYLARWLLRQGERWGVRHAHGCIAVSRFIAAGVRTRHRREAAVIPNGVDLPAPCDGTDHLRRFGLQPGRYLLQVGRFVPEKKQSDTIRAFGLANLSGWKLALVGTAENDRYGRHVRRLADAVPNVVMAGFQQGETLQALYAHAGGFVLPSSHEGLPIALLEALSHGLPVLASDIPAHRELNLPSDRYFPAGDVGSLARKMALLIERPFSEAERLALRSWLEREYDWDGIARRTLEVYRRALQV